MDDKNPFVLNVAGVTDLVTNPINKVQSGFSDSVEGRASDKYDALSLDMSDEELLKLSNQYEKRSATYDKNIKARVARIKASYLGHSANSPELSDTDTVLPANIQFEAEETFLAAALAKNPDPVVYCDNTPEGNAIATSIKTMLQYHADQLVLRRKLTLMVRQWSMNLLGGLKPGWNEKINDIAIDNTKIQDYVFDPDGYVDAYGDFSSWYGERKKVTAEKLIELFPKHKDRITLEVDGDLGTDVVYTEWWPNDDYCFYTFKDVVLDKHKNQYFKYPEPVLDGMGQPVLDSITGEPQMTTPRNHFPYPKKPGVFLSVFSLQEQPHDITSLIEQNIPTQRRITRRTQQIDFNVSTQNNSFALSEDNFNQETGKQAAEARKKGNPILIPSGGPISNAFMPLPAQGLPSDVFNELEIAKNDLRNSWGIQGIASQQPDEDQTARGMILNQSHDTSRIGGGIGTAVEQVADNIFNWMVQLYCVFYDEEHFAAVMGNAKAVEYVTLSQQDLSRQVVVSVAPDSMKPKDEVTEMNLAQALFDKGAIGPLTLLERLSFANPKEAAADGVLYKMDPAAYFRLNFPEEFARMQQAQMEQTQLQMQQQAQGVALNAQAGAVPPEQANGEPEAPLAVEPASAALSQIPL